MRNNIIFIITLVLVSAAVYGIFSLVFPEPSALMGWCVASGILMTLILSSNLLVVSSHHRLTVKNAATTWALNLSGILLFVWTLIFTFTLGPYEDSERSLNPLYIGYLVILILGFSIWLMADRGGVIAQTKNAEVQSGVQSRQVYVDQLNQIIINAKSCPVIDRSVNYALSRNLDMLRSLPSSTFESSCIDDQLSEAITTLDEAIDNGNQEKASAATSQLSLILKSIRI